MVVTLAPIRSLLTNKMKEFGFDPGNESLDPSTAAGIGNLAARSSYWRDGFSIGSNQDGEPWAVSERNALW
jgi:hypothetical protein